MTATLTVERGAGSAVWRRFRRNSGAMVGLVLLVLLMLLAALGPLLVGSPSTQDLAARLAPPSTAHLLGTDQLAVTF